MKRIRQDGQIIPVTDYDPDGPPPVCADFKCAARMKIIPESRENGMTTRVAYAASIRRGDHRDGCSELAHESDFYEESLSLKQTVLAGRHVILSLNDLFGLPPEMWENHAPTPLGQKPQTRLQAFKESLRDHDDNKGHSSHSIKSVQDLISHIKRIHDHGDDAALNKTHVTWQDKTIPFAEFFLDTQDSQKDFFRELYKKSKCGHDFKCAVHNNEQSAWDMPRLLRFKPSQRTRENPMDVLDGTAIHLKEQHDATKVPLILQHQISMHQSRRALPRDVFANDVYVLAAPQVNYTRTSPQICAYNAQPKRPKFVYMQWSIEGEHQFMPAKGIRLPKPYRGHSPKMI